jgi:hypothetical protein
MTVAESGLATTLSQTVERQVMPGLTTARMIGLIRCAANLPVQGRKDSADAKKRNNYCRDAI